MTRRNEETTVAIADKRGLDPDECERELLDHFWNVMVGEVDYAYFRRHKLPYFESPAVVAVLRHRWKAFNGVTRDKFAVHFAFVLHRIDDDEFQTFLGTVRTYEALKEMLQADPL